MKKTLSLVLALVMVALMLPVAAFTTSADEAPYYYYEDFTKAGTDDGTSGNISASLPTGWLAKDDPDTVLGHKAWTTTLNYDWVEKPHSIEKEAYVDEPKNIGVRLGGADQGIAMTEAAGLPSKILNAEVDYVLTVTWNSTHKFAHIRFGWSGETAPTTSNVAAAQYVALNHTGGPSNAGGGATIEAYGDGEGKGGNWMFNGTYSSDIQNEYGSQMSYAEILGAHSAPLQAGAVFTSTFEIVGGKVVAVYNEIGGTTVKYMPSADVSAKGYFSIWITNWGANNTANIRTVEIKEGTIESVNFPKVSNTEILQSVDFATVQTDAALDAAGFVVSATAAGTYNYTPDGLQLKFGTGDFLINKEVELNKVNAYIVDFTYKMDPSVWIWAAEFGFTPAMLEGEAAAVNAALAAHHGVADGNASFKMRANEGTNNGLACDSWTYYNDTFTEAYTSGTLNPSASAVEAACGADKVSIRVRILVAGGTAEYAFMTVGDENFYLKRDTPMTQDSVAGLVGFTFIGDAKAERGVTLQNFSIIKCDLGDTTGGTEVKAEKDKAYTDAAATYYKDGYVLHYMDFATEGLTYGDTNYSFASNSSLDRVVKVEEDVLKFTNKGTKAAYLLFTANAIPAAITEYTAIYSFRFIGDVNSYFGFVRGISLKADGSRDKSSTIELSYKGEIDDCATADTEAWDAIVTAMKAGEWVNVTVSNVGRYVESVTVECGENTATFKMDASKNKAAVDGYMGFIIGKTTSVEIAGVAIVAGKADSFTMPTWPTGVELGANVQNVTAEAVAEGTKPDYSALIAELLGEGGDNTGTNPGDEQPNDTTPEQTTAATTTAATTKAAEAKKGCKGSIVALPAIIATAIFGCAVVSKKKED